MRIQRKSYNIYTKSLNEVEGYLLNIVKRFFENDGASIENTREDIILEAIRRAKKEVEIEYGAVLSVNGETGVVELSANDVNAEPIIKKRQAFNKDFGNTTGTVCEGNDSRLDHSDFYDKAAIDLRLGRVEKLTTGVKFRVLASSWNNFGSKFKTIVSHNLNLTVESFSVSALDMNYVSQVHQFKILNKNSIEIYSDTRVDLYVVIKQAIVSTVAIPNDVQEAITGNSANIAANSNKIKTNLESIEEIRDLIREIEAETGLDLSEIISSINLVEKSVSDLDKSKANTTHNHNINNLEGLDDFEPGIPNDFGLVGSQSAITVRLKRGSTNTTTTYVGEQGELIINTDLKEVALHDGSTRGGTPLAKKSHNHSYNSLLDKPNLLNADDYYSKDDTYNRSEVDDKISGIVTPEVDLNNYYTITETDSVVAAIGEMELITPPTADLPLGNIVYNVLKNKDDIDLIKSSGLTPNTFNVLEVNWIDSNDGLDLLCYDLEHNLNIDISTLDVKFYVDNASVIIDFEYISTNQIKLYTDSTINLKVVLLKRSNVLEQVIKVLKITQLEYDSLLVKDDNVLYVVVGGAV